MVTGNSWLSHIPILFYTLLYRNFREKRTTNCYLPFFASKPMIPGDLLGNKIGRDYE